jgi:hypothetical protein
MRALPLGKGQSGSTGKLQTVCALARKPLLSKKALQAHAEHGAMFGDEMTGAGCWQLQELFCYEENTELKGRTGADAGFCSSPQRIQNATLSGASL